MGRSPTCGAEQERLLDKTGERMPVEDSYIAATARRHGLTIATGNDRDFKRPGLKVFIHSWSWHSHAARSQEAIDQAERTSQGRKSSSAASHLNHSVPQKPSLTLGRNPWLT